MYVYTNILNSLLVYFDQNALSYLRGIAAYCMYSARANVQLLTGILNTELQMIRASKPPASALGRLVVTDKEIRIDNSTVQDASTVTFSQLASSTGNVSVDCLNFMR
eukprot:2739664-Prymnesium_polylepis.1